MLNKEQIFPNPRNISYIQRTGTGAIRIVPIVGEPYILHYDEPIKMELDWDELEDMLTPFQQHEVDVNLQTR